jgi:hypothetical protein
MLVVCILVIQDADVMLGADTVHVEGLGGDVFFKDVFLLPKISRLIMAIDAKENIFDILVEIGHLTVFFMADFAELDIAKLFGGMNGVLLLAESISRVVKKLCATGLCYAETAGLLNVFR